MKKIVLISLLFSLNAVATTNAKYFERPLNCPLRFSNLSNFRDQVQALVASLGKNCSQEAINQLNSNVSNLEGIATSYETYEKSEDAKSSSQYAKNVGQILGSINLITSNNACFYDIRSRGVLPVLADVIMSTSQLGLLVPSAKGQAVAAGGYIAGSGIKIINELLKKKFNFDKPEERRAFIQLNCAFFENRRIMEESGIFNPETQEFRDELVDVLKKERLELLKSQQKQDLKILELEETLLKAIGSIDSAREKNLSPSLDRNIDEVIKAASVRPVDYTEKLRQASVLSEKLKGILAGVKILKLNHKVESSKNLLIGTLEKIIPEFEPGAKAWTNTIDEFEMNIRGPLFAFLAPVSNALKKEIMTAEAELALIDPEEARKISRLRIEIKAGQSSSWTVALRLSSLETKIASFEVAQTQLFSNTDEGSSNAVEILDYYRTLQSSILGKEGRDYLKNAIRAGYNMRDGLNIQMSIMNRAASGKEKCAAAEKVRFAWAQYRYKIQEAHDFVATNIDLYRSSFRIGKEKLKRAAIYVLNQMDSVEDFTEGKTPERQSVGDLMLDASLRVKETESLLQRSNCF